MPETAQDAFETLHPARAPITADELRLQRSGSFGASSQSTNDPDITQQQSLNVDKRHPRKSRISFTDLDSCIGGPDTIYGYKRESSHR